MGRTLPEIDADLHSWIREQRLFFVSTAPLSASGHINCSPKGGDSFLVLGPKEVAYLDYTGSGAETAAHLRENGRIVLLFCAFAGPPRILRLHGRGAVLPEGSPEFQQLLPQFPENPGTRSIIHVQVHRLTLSCGFSVPQFTFNAPRTQLDAWSKKQGPAGLKKYRSEKNRRSIDGLPAFDPAPPRP